MTLTIDFDRPGSLSTAAPPAPAPAPAALPCATEPCGTPAPLPHPQHSPWGAVTHVQPIACGVLSTICAYHGGYAVHDSTRLAPAARALALVEPQAPHWLWFEQERAWAIAALALKGIVPDPVYRSARPIVRFWWPETYEQLLGVTLPPVTMAHALQRRNAALATTAVYEVEAVYQDWAWDVPPGHVYLIGRSRRDGRAHSTIVPRSLYDGHRSRGEPLALQHFPPWCHNPSAPRFKRPARSCEPVCGSRLPLRAPA